MALGKAIRFVKDVRQDGELRRQCVAFASKEEMLAHFEFDEVEFDDAINMQLVKCQTYDEAEAYHHLRMWFAML